MYKVAAIPGPGQRCAPSGTIHNCAVRLGILITLFVERDFCALENSAKRISFHCKMSVDFLLATIDSNLFRYWELCLITREKTLYTPMKLLIRRTVLGISHVASAPTL